MMTAVLCLSAAGVRAATTEVNVEKAGTLSTLVTGTETTLKLTGSINGTDVKLLRQMINEKRLTSLDLSEVKIVKGGEAYYNTYTTENNVIGQSMFTECSKLRTIKLPASVSDIQGNAFPWLFIDPETLIEQARANGFNAEVVVRGDHYDYLARITRVKR